MSDDYQDLMDEKEYERRLLMHQRLRKLLLVINLIFALYLCVQLVKVCYKHINRTSEPTYANKIDNLMNDGSNPYKLRNTPVRDYVVYGTNLSLFYYDYDVSGSNGYYVKDGSKFILKNLANEKVYTFNTSSYLDENIDLTSLDVGTYVVFYLEQDGLDDMIVTHESYDSANQYTIYSLPYKKDDKVVHKKIVIGAIFNNSFPVFTIKVSEEKMLSNDGYDIAINYQEGNKTEQLANYLKNRFKDIGINVYLNKGNTSSSSKASFYKYVYDNNIYHAIDLVAVSSGNFSYIHSTKTKGYINNAIPSNSSSVIENGEVMDENLFIRELGGRVTGAGICKEDSSSVSCAMGDAKNYMGVSAIVVSIDNNADSTMLNYYGSIIYSSFVNKFVK